ncbi:5-oxoprolinase subunit PxpB [Deinococcus sp. Marseille-Q6407]|uniref:5-oxoprolinase subunit PxpB n=1 Tax=Deinococcus sp. Marseille-Q6407 TaxID=2969223 RepID=UPI0021C0496D|nr:5-oxoprolinase subunit PxpB [Deinococcus sp. Marseille-Q6407]
MQAHYWHDTEPEQLPALAQALLHSGLPGLLDAVPAYESLYIEFDKRALTLDTLTGWLAAWTPGNNEAAGRLVEIPACYDGEDLAAAAEFSGLSPAEVAARHSEQTYRVRALGFVAGFPFMETTPPELQLPRRAAPRARVPAHSLAVAGAQTGIYPVEAPGGWNLLGRTLQAAYDPRREPAFLVQPGDRVRFVPQAPGAPPLAPIQPLDLLPTAPQFPLLRVERPGALSLVMNRGRFQTGRFGLVRSGPLDPQAAALATELLGNPADAPLLELHLRGPELTVLQECWLAVTGLGLTALLDGQPQPPYSAFRAQAGQRLHFRPNGQGRVSYLAVAGGFEAAGFMGSASTDLKGGLGRPLQAGQLLGSAQPRHLRRARQFLPWWVRQSAGQTAPLELRLIPVAAGEPPEPALLGFSYRVRDLDRMAARLDGPTVPGGEIVSEGSPVGTVQLPPGGVPIILLNDKGTLGGYRRGGRIHPDDLPQLVQSLPGREVRFIAGDTF